jgi:citrate synthase
MYMDLQTKLSDVDGEAGRLVVAGWPVERLAAEKRFEDAVALLWGEPGAAPLGRGRAAAWERLPRLGDALDASDGMDALRAATAHLPGGASRVELIGAVAVFAAAWARRRAGADPIPPDPSLGHAADVVRMATGATPDAARARAADAYLVTVMDHGMNASTFAARVVASTASDDVSAVVAAIGALKGPLHGGAPGPVLDMLDAIATPAGARAWLKGELAAGRRIMGMGHRIYRVRDPRAAVFERAVASLPAGERLELARAVEREAAALLRERHPDRPLCANVEFYTAVLLEAVGLDRAFFTPMFAVGRVAGWLAHTAEQRAEGRLIRPSSRYVGPSEI